MSSEGLALPLNMIIIDYYMPEMNGAETCEKIIEIYKDFKVKNEEDSEG